MSRLHRITEKLTSALQPTQLDVCDNSHLHAGHAGALPGGETHYTVIIASPQFAGRSRVAQHQLVNAALADEFAGGLHALSITVI